MISVGDYLGEFEITGICSERGGMGALMFAENIFDPGGEKYVLKYCKLLEPELRQRFGREVKLMLKFQGNSKVISVVGYDLEHDPPYYVMPFYPDGDLTSLQPIIQADLAEQERIFNAMLDCVAELHTQGVYHRDIKPANYLVDGGNLIVSDLGLGTRSDNFTRITRTLDWAGTRGYMPPEYVDGGFKNPQASGDIFMLGKTMYVLLTSRDPEFLLSEGVDPVLFAVIERCCALDPKRRYRTIADMRQSLTSAYDVLLGRLSGNHRALATLQSITEQASYSKRFNPTEVQNFVEQLEMLDGEDLYQVCFEISDEVFRILANESVAHVLPRFLVSYRKMAERATYAWSFAETIAKRMQTVFNNEWVSSSDKFAALEIAAIAARRQHRFAAMDTCKAMVSRVKDGDLALKIHDLILSNEFDFFKEMSASSCKAALIKRALGEEEQQA